MLPYTFSILTPPYPPSTPTSLTISPSLIVSPTHLLISLSKCKGSDFYKSLCISIGVSRDINKSLQLCKPNTIGIHIIKAPSENIDEDVITVIKETNDYDELRKVFKITEEEGKMGIEEGVICRRGCIDVVK